MPYQPYDAERAAALHRRRVLSLGLIGMTVALIAQALLLRGWTRLDTRPPAWDQSIHLEIARDYQQAMAAKNWAAVLHPVPKPGMPAFPPLYHLALQPAMSRLDPARAALWVNYVYLCVLAFCLFALAFEFMPTYVALGACIAFVASPAVQGLLLTQLVDLPVLACATAAFWALVRSEEFSEWGGSLTFSVLFAVGMLHKWSFFAYMIPAYWVWLQAVSRKQTMLPALASFVLAAALTAPWYLANWPLLLPRLVAASSDFAVPVWKGAAVLDYFWQTLNGFGPFFWFLGWAGLFIARYPRKEFQSWLIMLWVLSSYVFWAIVPNRQLRFLLPGLPGLAVALCGAWPVPIVWGLAGAQAVFALNYYNGWVGPLYIPTPFTSVMVLPTEPPRSERWPIDEILVEAEKNRDPEEPIANLTLVANHPLFNGPNFTWRRQELGLAHVRIRGVNRRLCEFSQFVVLKTKDLGPASVTEGLPEAAKIIQGPKSWVARGYAVLRRWPLPDGSEAVLYGRAKPTTPPLKMRALTKFQYYEHGAFAAEDAAIQLGAWDAARGVYPRARLTAGQFSIRGLQLSGLDVELEDVLIIPVDLEGDPWKDFRLVKLKTLRVRSGRVEAASLKNFLQKRVPGLALASLVLDEGSLRAAGTFRGYPVAAELAVELQRERGRLDLRLKSLRLGSNPVPVGALNRIKELSISLLPNPETPFTIELSGLSLKNGALTIP